MRRLSALLLLCLALCLAACSSSNNNTPPSRGDGGGYGRSARARDTGPMLLDIIPADGWWRDVGLVEPLNLSADQLTALDKISNDQRDEIARLERDLPVAMRDVRTAIDADPATSADISAAAQRVRNIRDSLYDRQAQMLIAERLVLTKQQWSKLLDELQARRDRMNNNNNPGNRGGYPRGGRGRPWG